MPKGNRDYARDPNKRVGPTVGKKDKNANYAFNIQKEPTNPMGHGDFANMPSQPKFMTFDKEHSYRDGIVNSFTVGLTDVSDIHENEAKEK